MRKLISTVAALALLSTALFAQAARKPVVYFSHEVSAQSALALYERLGKPLSGRVAVQQSMGSRAATCTSSRSFPRRS